MNFDIVSQLYAVWWVPGLLDIRFSLVLFLFQITLRNYAQTLLYHVILVPVLPFTPLHQCAYSLYRSQYIPKGASKENFFKIDSILSN